MKNAPTDTPEALAEYAKMVSDTFGSWEWKCAQPDRTIQDQRARDEVRVELREAIDRLASLAASAASLVAEPVASERQIAEALRRHGFTLIKTATGYDVLKLGHVEAQGADHV